MYIVLRVLLYTSVPSGFFLGFSESMRARRPSSPMAFANTTTERHRSKESWGIPHHSRLKNCHLDQKIFSFAVLTMKFEQAVADLHMPRHFNDTDIPSVLQILTCKI